MKLRGFAMALSAVSLTWLGTAATAWAQAKDLTVRNDTPAALEVTLETLSGGPIEKFSLPASGQKTLTGWRSPGTRVRLTASHEARRSSAVFDAGVVAEGMAEPAPQGYRFVFLAENHEPAAAPGEPVCAFGTIEGPIPGCLGNSTLNVGGRFYLLKGKTAGLKGEVCVCGKRVAPPPPCPLTTLDVTTFCPGPK
jgi:hypothetical protein